MQNTDEQRAELNRQVPLNSVHKHYLAATASPPFQVYVQAIGRYCPKQGKALEWDAEHGYASIWLSLQRISASGFSGNPLLAERAKCVNEWLGGRARFRYWQEDDAIPEGDEFDVIHHFGLLHRKSLEQIHDSLARQIGLSRHIIFSVPSNLYPLKDARTSNTLMSLEEWSKALRPYKPIAVGYGGDPRSGGREQILCVLPGRATSTLVSIPAVAKQQSVATPIADESRTLRMRWEGAFWMHGSLAHVNREICRELASDPEIELSAIETHQSEFDAGSDPRFSKLANRVFAPLDGAADIHVRQNYSVRMNRAQEGKLALMQPWDFGFLPSEWIEPIVQNFDDVWCNSRFVWDAYVNSGIPEDRLHMVPLGFDPAVFHRDVPPPDMPGTDSLLARIKGKFVFLYVGGTVERKGFHTLLAAYLKAFSSRDDAVLLIKDHGAKGLYASQTLSAQAIAASEDASSAQVIYLSDELNARQLAGVIGLAHCAVHPYRAEGFCLPVIEAMACGVPAVVTAGGPTDDFVDETVGWRLPSEKKPYLGTVVEHARFVGRTTTFEVSTDGLTELMREIYNDPAGARARGERAAVRAASGWTWSHTEAIVKQRMKDLRDRPKRIRGAASNWTRTGILRGGAEGSQDWEKPSKY